jgi:2-oxoglutarate ferredoxin oxidoreductase subunit delta
LDGPDTNRDATMTVARSLLTNSVARVPIDKPVRHHGTVHVIESRCKECSFCVTFCPEEVLEVSDYYNPRGYRPVRVKAGKAGDCIACRFCEHVCPDYAIYVEEDTP